MSKLFRPLLLSLAAVVMVILVGVGQTKAWQSNSSHDLAATIMSTQAPTEKLTRADRYVPQIENGLQYFRQLVQEQIKLVEQLNTALRSGDLEWAKTAYIDARPPYEEIEVFAASFEQEDSDIDARPYAFEAGEQSPDFRGFHRIERLIFRDANLAAAVPYGDTLLTSLRSLDQKLNDLSNFSAALNFQGMITLATEVPAKKISGEEETWSDQSVLIFKHNWIGIHSQFKPFAAQLDAATVAKVDAAYMACMKTVEPFFQPGKTAATPYSSLSVAQRRAIVEASYAYRDALIQAAQKLGLALEA